MGSRGKLKHVIAGSRLRNNLEGAVSFIGAELSRPLFERRCGTTAGAADSLPCFDVFEDDGVTNCMEAPDTGVDTPVSAFRRLPLTIYIAGRIGGRRHGVGK